MRCTVVVSRFVVVFSFLLIIVAHCTAGKNQSPFISIAKKIEIVQIKILGVI
jgi:hypothetical protein